MQSDNSRAVAMRTCRACRGSAMLMFLPLGLHPPANSFRRAVDLAEPEPAFHLDTHVCLECGLVQVPDQIPADFFRNYLYIPSASSTMHRHFAEFASRLRERYLRADNSLLVDIGCNDGLFLGAARDLGVRTLGIDPAANIAEMAQAKGLQVVNEYFTPSTARAIRDTHGPAAAIVTTNTFNHIDNLHAFMEGVRIVLADTGVFVVEVPAALHFVQQNEFDTVYHEHLSVFSVKSLVDLFRFFDMEIVEIEALAVHGGSMRVHARCQRSGGSAVTASWLERESAAGLFDAATYHAFARSVAGIRAETMSILRRLKSAGKSIAGYGAPAKGNTLLNYYQVGPDLLDYLADKNPLKHGLFSPGMHIPIRGAEEIRRDPPDYLLILAWNFAGEIMEQQEEFRAAGGRFIIPIPKPVIVG